MARVVLLAVLAVAPALSQGTVEGHGAARRFISRKYGFSMAVPVGWGVSTGLDTPVFFYAPRSARFIQDQIPEGGAVIMTGPQGRSKTPEGWALADMNAEASAIQPIEKFQFPPESRALHAVICAYDEAKLSPDERAEHSIGVYWEFGGKLFAGHLRYNAGDKASSSFEKAFFWAIRSLRPVH